MTGMSVMIKPASGMCNMACTYCFYQDEAQKRKCSSCGLMSEDTLKQIVRRTIFRAEKQIYYIFQGGEPTLRGLDFFQRFVEFEGKYNQHNLIVHKAIQTNGLLINEEWCKFFREHHFLVGLSIDGTQNTHNIYRRGKDGRGTFDQVECAAVLLEQYQVEYNILTVVTPSVAEHIQEIYEFYQKKGWKYQQYIPCLEPWGEGHGNWEYSLGAKQYGDFLISLFGLWRKDLEKGIHPYIRQFEQWIGIAAGYSPSACEQRGCCSIQYAVEADGSVYPCDFYMFDKYCLGNFNQDRLPQLDARRKEIGFLEDSLLLEQDCISCQYYRLCRGGCQRNRDYREETGRYKNYYCLGLKRFFDACGEEIQKIAHQIF